MKLYATITSERASKGQGGNANLEIVLTGEFAGDYKELARINLWNSAKMSEGCLFFDDVNPFYGLILREVGEVVKDHKIIKFYQGEQKGERQKGEASES